MQTHTVVDDIDTKTFLERLRREHSEREKRFPGFPGYLDDKTLIKIEADVNEHSRMMVGMLAEMFGTLAVQQMDPEEVRFCMRELAQSVAWHAAGHVSGEATKQAQQASMNMLNGVLAGIELGKRPPA